MYEQHLGSLLGQLARSAHPGSHGSVGMLAVGFVFASDLAGDGRPGHNNPHPA